MVGVAQLVADVSMSRGAAGRAPRDEGRTGCERRMLCHAWHRIAFQTSQLADGRQRHASRIDSQDVEDINRLDTDWAMCLTNLR